MATLEEGQEYGLASDYQRRGNVSVIHFKLNDSVLKALEDFCKVKSKQVQKTTIQFKENQGVIRIPSHVSSAGNQPDRKYQFSLSAIPDLNGSFDCVQQTSRQGHGGLQSLGNMQYKVSVHASEDVYDRTRAKMNLVEEESKKVCTKEIKPSGRHISKKVKKILPAGSLKLAQVSKVSPMSKPVSSLGSGSRHVFSNPSTTSAVVQSSLKSLSNPISSSFTRIQSSSSSALSSLSQAKHSSNSPSMIKPTGSTQQGVLTSTSSKQSSGAINMPYRDRVIHLLALRPYKKPELILRLQRDGIREKDRNCLGSILQQVAVMNKKDNSYSLARSAWIDVRQDWPFYNDHDKTLLKRNLQQESRCIATSPAVSPASSNPESPGSSQKRSLEETDDHALNPNKKKRISHVQQRQQEEHGSTNLKRANNEPSPDADRENLEGTLEGNGELDYRGKYVNIRDKEQRQKYKQEFNREYEEYRELHKDVAEVARKFQSLRSRINETEEGTKDFEELKKQVLEEYEAQKSDPKFMEKKRRMEFLHQKLGHIKKLIYEFDQRLVTCS